MDAEEFTFVIIHIRVNQALLGLAAAVPLSSGSRPGRMAVQVSSYLN
jgi:hypothetical protein